MSQGALAQDIFRMNHQASVSSILMISAYQLRILEQHRLAGILINGGT
jgi:hypothetical protein